MASHPRVFCIPATDSPVVAVIRRGPSKWFHVGRWNTREWGYESGAWFRGRLFPQKCDLSPDGRWFAYSAQKPGSLWRAGEIYEAISRLPWLHALAAWEAGTTYTRGIRFDGKSGMSEIGRPDVGDVGPLLRQFGLKLNAPQQFAVERRRGWEETPDTPQRNSSDVWDEWRTVRMSKRQPHGNALLEVEGSYAAFRDLLQVRTPPVYSITRSGGLHPLENVQWADWSADGTLLAATTDGILQARDPGQGGIIFSHNLGNLQPDPAPPPDWAKEW